ncbi:MAG TPA: S1C family serine protease [Steroidobacteraceae bacterium]|nr:S1C family serine protease [Steroidobacteraceae bacterium]
MAANSLLKQYSEERAALVQNAVPRAAAIILGRRRVLSGIRWRDDLIVTAAEAIGGAEQVDVRLEGDELEAQVVATDLTTDIAILRVGAAGGGASTATSTLAPTASASAQLLRVGETIAVVGRTLRGPAAIWGTVQLAGPAWSSRRGGKIDQRLELDVSFDPTFEGAAVIDTNGNVVAMAVPGPYHRVLGIPATTIETVVAKVDQFGHLPKPYIGIRLQPLWLDDDTRTKLGRKSRGIAAVGGVDAGSPADQAHIELGDLLLTLDSEPAESVNGMARRIASTTPGQIIALEVLRGGKPLTINVQIGERPRH